MSVPSNLPVWQQLKAHHAAIADQHLRDLFAADPERFNRFSRRFGDLLVDFSKHRMTGETFDLLIELARQNALAIGAGHSFIIFLAPGFYPINILKAVQNAPEVCRIFCATANPAATARLTLA